MKNQYNDSIIPLFLKTNFDTLHKPLYEHDSIKDSQTFHAIAHEFFCNQ